MREMSNPNRQGAIEEVLSAIGGTLVAVYGKSTTGPGVLVIFDVPEPGFGPAMSGVAVSSGAFQNVELTRLFTMEEVAGIREKARKIHGVYRPPGK
jgi:hypothetical protein